MNQIHILKSNAKVTKNQIQIKLDSENKLVFDIDIDYMTILAIEHLKYNFNKNTNIVDLCKHKKFFNTNCDKIANIISENVISTIECVATALNKNRDSMQEAIEVYNRLNLEAYMLSIMAEEMTNKMFALKK